MKFSIRVLVVGLFIVYLANKTSQKDDDKGENKVKSSIESSEEDLDEAEEFGIQEMNELYDIKEPQLFSNGLFLTEEHPARYVAAFNRQSDEAKHLAKLAYAALKGSRKLVDKFGKTNSNLTRIFLRKGTASPGTGKAGIRERCPRQDSPSCSPASRKYRTADGSCNNLEHLWWGSAMSTMQRFLDPFYEDGIEAIRRSSRTGKPLPSPRDISALIHSDKDIPLASVTHMLMQWGQFIDHDMTATAQSRGFNGTFPQCCRDRGAEFQPPELMHPDCLPIIVNPNDNFFGRLGVRCLEFVRSGPAPREDCGFGPREQLSQVTSFLDASMVYSSNSAHSDSLRIFRNGLLQYGKIESRKPILPKGEPDDLCRLGSLSTNCFRAGDARLSEQPALTSLHVVFLRLHNRIATELAAINPHWSDEKLFQESRRVIGAVVQHITYKEYLPIVLGPEVMKIFNLELTKKGYFEGYDPRVNPNIANSFSSAAYRFGHSLVQHNFARYDRNHCLISNNVSIHGEFNNRIDLQSAGSVDRLLLGLVNQPSQRRDEFITKELTNHLFQFPGFPFGMDLAAINIQRGRDHGLAPYVEWREPCGLSSVRSWQDLERVTNSEITRKFQEIYENVEDIDLFSAGLAEKPVVGGLVGPTFACIIAQQFNNLRTGDRFWYENPHKDNAFSPNQLEQIKRISLARILCRTLDNIETIQPFVFLTADTLRNTRINCNDPKLSQLNFDAWAERTVKLSDEAKMLPWLRPKQPIKTNVNQKNRINVKRPFGSNENISIVVQNHAVNSPVFVSDAIYGSTLAGLGADGSKLGLPIGQHQVHYDTVNTYQDSPIHPVRTYPAGTRPYVPLSNSPPSDPSYFNPHQQSPISMQTFLIPPYQLYDLNNNWFTNPNFPAQQLPSNMYNPTRIPFSPSMSSVSSSRSDKFQNDHEIPKPLNKSPLNTHKDYSGMIKNDCSNTHEFPRPMRLKTRGL